MTLQSLYPDETEYRRNMLESWQLSFQLQAAERRRPKAPADLIGNILAALDRIHHDGLDRIN